MDSYQVSSDFLKGLLAGESVRITETNKLYERYKGNNLPIFQKSGGELTQVNNQINNDYRGVIVNQKCGYLFGNPVSFNLDSTKYDDTAYAAIYNELQYFLLRNKFDDMNHETSKRTSAARCSAWLLYHDKETNERVQLLEPWEYILLKEGEDTILGIHHFTVKKPTKDGKSTYQATKMNVYDNQKITYYIETEDGDFILDNEEEMNPRPTRFSGVPIIEIVNNDEMQGDFEKVEKLIDAYDYLISVMQDEAEAFRLAYMGVYGAVLDDTTIADIKRNGIFQGLNEEMKVEFITKQINDTFFQNQKSTLNENIYKFSSVIDMSDEKFSGGNESGESRKWKLIPLENSVIVKERKFSSAYREMFKLLCNAWGITKNLKVNYLDIFWTFKRNIPIDLLYLADVATKYKGLISEDTRLGLLGGVVDDVEYEKKKMQEDMQDSLNTINLDSLHTDAQATDTTTGVE